MLILNRRVGERIIIDGGIIIELIQAGYHTTKIGVIAPAHVKIWREELVICPNCGTKGNHECSYRPLKVKDE